jgi:hypothetical protein
MIIRAFIISTTLIFSGCLSNNALMSNSIAQNNVYKINQLQFGMTQDEVYQIMRYPSSEDQVNTADGCYDIWFYVTKGNVLDQRSFVARNVTPLIFKDGIFIAMGRQYYNQLVQKSKEPQIPQSQELEQSEPMNEQKREDIKLEKTLEPQAQPFKNLNPENPIQKKVPETQTPPPPAAPPKTAPSQTAPVKPMKNKLKPLSMCSKPKRVESPTDQSAIENSNDSTQPSSNPKLNDEDREMLEKEQEENFNDW